MTTKNFANDVIGNSNSLVQNLAAMSGRAIILTVVDSDGKTNIYQAGVTRPVIGITLDVKVLQDIRQLEMAERVWAGLAVEQLGQALWPSVAEREAAASEGLSYIFSTLDSEQNEREATALSSDWGQYYRSLVVFIGKKESGANGSFDTLPAENVRQYKERLLAFRFYLRRRISGATDPHVVAALAMVPDGLRELTKVQLLDLARRIKGELLTGIELRQITQNEEPAADSKARTNPVNVLGDEPAAPPEQEPDDESQRQQVERFEVKKWFKKQMDSSSARLKFALLIGVWTVFLVVSLGMTFWSKFFWVGVGVCGSVLAAVLIVGGIRKYAPKPVRDALEKFFDSVGDFLGNIRNWRLWKLIGRMMNPPAKPGNNAPASSRWLYLLYEVLYWLNPINLVNGIWKGLKFLWVMIVWCFTVGLGRLWRIIPGTQKLGPILDTFAEGLAELLENAREDIRRLSQSVNQLALQLWQYNAVRVIVLALPAAMPVACLLAVPYVGVRKQPLWLLVVELLLTGGMFALIYFKRKALIRLVLQEMHPTDIPNVKRLRDTYVDKEETSFEPIDLVMPVSAQPERFDGDATDIQEGAAVLRQLLHNLGFAETEKDGQHEGDEVGDNAEEILTGNTGIMIDGARRRQRKLRIGVGIDCSISTMQPTADEAVGAKFRRGVRFGLMLEQAIAGLRGVQSNFCGYTADVIFDCGTAGEGRITGLVPEGAANNDAAMLHHLSQEYSSRTVEIFLLVSDALPSGCAWGALNLLASELEESGRTVIQVAVDKISDSAIGTVIDLVDKPLVNAATELADIIQQAVANNG